MNNGWSELTLGELCRFEQGTSPTLKTEPGEYPLVVTASYQRSSVEFQFDEPAVCIPLISSTGHGNAALHRVHYQEGKFALANLLVAAIPKPGGPLDAKFLWRYLSAVKDRKLVPLMQGTANVSLKEKDLLGVTIPLPSLAEQQQIVARLDAIESRLTSAQKLREEQEKGLKAVLSAAFHKLEADVTWKPLAEVAPLAWRQITIDPDESYTEFGVRSFYKGIFLRRKVAGSTFSWQDLYRLRAGHIVFSNIMAWEKAIAVAQPEHDGWVGNHRMLVCEPKPDVVLPSYLLHYFMTAEGFAKVLQASPGTAARNKTLKADNLMAIEVPIPSLSRQRTFESLCEHVARIRAAQTPQLAQVNKVLPSLLDRIFN